MYNNYNNQVQPKANNNPVEVGFSPFMERQARHLRSFRTPNQNGGWLHQYYLTNDIGGPELYIDMIQEIRMANPNDSIFVYINSEGGEVDSGIQIINAFQECNCDVVLPIEFQENKNVKIKNCSFSVTTITEKENFRIIYASRSK